MTYIMEPRSSQLKEVQLVPGTVQLLTRPASLSALPALICLNLIGCPPRPHCIILFEEFFASGKVVEGVVGKIFGDADFSLRCSFPKLCPPRMYN